ncbi:MAG TPA: glycosyltransferase family 2 protein [Phycisphaerae bacterium]|nr:glycosyltransferase family 2 protein [Phycisphaerae bacterium]
MFEGKTVAVVVPAYNEETQIAKVLDTMPDMVDCILVVDDQSRDRTPDVVREHIAAEGSSPRTVLIRHERNAGVGAAIVTGYKEAIRRKIDVTAVMAGDAQMDPDELPLLVAPVARGQCDYTKGNRLFYRGAWETIPRHRFLGNAFLSMLTKIASGYWHVADSQTGYTAISLQALRTIDLENIYPRYGYPNDMLVRLNIFDFRVADVAIRPVYNVGEQSKMKLWKVVPTMTWMIFRRFCWRLMRKYVIHDFHPLVLFYAFGFVSFWIGLLMGMVLFVIRLFGFGVAGTSALLSVFLFLTGLQLQLFGMWFDMEMNRDLKVVVPGRSPEELAADRPGQDTPASSN